MTDWARLVEVRNRRYVTGDSEPEFWIHFQRAVLLALRDEGLLNESQLGLAEERLRRQHRAGSAAGKRGGA